MKRQISPELTADQGMGLIAILIILGIIGGAIAGGAVAAFVLLRESARPAEETAKFLPADTQVYFSLNLRPAIDQRRKFRVIVKRFQDNPNLQPKLDEFLNEVEQETSIDLKNKVLPWLAEEIAVGVLDIPGSIIGTATGGAPLIVVFIGTNDHMQTSDTLEQWIEYIEGEEDLVFNTDPYQGITVYSEKEDFQHYAVTQDFLLFATDLDILEETIDRLAGKDTSASLFSGARFQDARAALPEPRVSMIYVDSGTIWKDVQRQFGGALPRDVRREIDDLVPEWFAMTSSFIDRGAKLVISAPEVGEESELSSLTNSLSATKMMPSDTLALVSFVMIPDLDPLREQLQEQGLEDLDPMMYGLIAAELGMAIDEEDTLDELFDALLDKVEDTIGLDLEEEVLAWMTGEVAFALLPTNFWAISEDPADEPLEALAFIQFDTEQRPILVITMGKISKLLFDRLGLQSDPVSYGEGTGATFDLRDMVGPTAYKPGYLILGNHLVLGTTVDALRLAASVSDNSEAAITDEAEFSRLIKDTSGARNPLIYLNIRGFREAIVLGLDSDDLEKYEEEVGPFVEPFRALLMTGETLEGVNHFSMVLTIE